MLIDQEDIKVKRIIKSIAVVGILSMLLVGCSSSGIKTESVEVTNEELKASMKEVAVSAINQYFGIDINDGVEREETAFENIMIDNKAGTRTHVSNMFKGTTTVEAEEGDIQSYGVVLDADNQTVQGAIIQLFSTAKPAKYDVATLKAIGDKFAVTTGVVDNPSEWIYEGLEKSISNKQLSVLKYNNENIKGYLLIGISLQTGQVTYFEKTVQGK